MYNAHFLHTAGMDHLLHLGRGSGGSTGAESEELQMACLMGLVSYLSGLPEVQRVSPFHESRILNAVAGAIVQSGNDIDRPLTDAGLDGTGEVIQVKSFYLNLGFRGFYAAKQTSLQMRIRQTAASGVVLVLYMVQCCPS